MTKSRISSSTETIAIIAPITAASKKQEMNEMKTHGLGIHVYIYITITTSIDEREKEREGEGFCTILAILLSDRMSLGRFPSWQSTGQQMLPVRESTLLGVCILPRVLRNEKRVVYDRKSEGYGDRCERRCCFRAFCSSLFHGHTSTRM